MSKYIYRKGDTIQLAFDPSGTQQVPVGTYGTVTSNVEHDQTFLWVQWHHDLHGSFHAPVRMVLITPAKGGPKKGCAKTCNTPWWHFWNPCSRFGWATYIAGGAFIPHVVEALARVF